MNIYRSAVLTTMRTFDINENTRLAYSKGNGWLLVDGLHTEEMWQARAVSIPKDVANKADGYVLNWWLNK